MNDQAVEAMALLATEWFKAARRSMRIIHEVAPTRMEREHAQLTYSFRRVMQALADNGMRIQDFAGQQYSPSLPVEPVNPEDFDNEEGLVIGETVEPTVLHEGRLILRGRVVLAKG